MAATGSGDIGPDVHRKNASLGSVFSSANSYKFLTGLVNIRTPIKSVFWTQTCRTSWIASPNFFISAHSFESLAGKICSKKLDWLAR